MPKLLVALGLILTGLITGYLWQRWAVAQGPYRAAAVGQIRRRLQVAGLLGFMPVSFMAAVWSLSFDNIRLLLLPLIGAGTLLLGGLCGLGAARLLGQNDLGKGTLFCCGSFTNIGSIGALVCYIFLGESGFALIALYKMFEELIYYSIGFPVARYYSTAKQGAAFKQRMRKVFTDPFFLTATGAFIVGFVLNQSGLSRPAFFETVTAIFVPAGTLVLITSIGLGMRFTKVNEHLVQAAAIAVIKFAVIPAAALLAAYAAGFHHIDNGLPLKVVLIAASMPVAFTALVAASLYQLDLDLANACWLVTTAGLLLILPWLQFILKYL